MRIAHVTSGLDRSAAGVGVVVAALSAEQQSLGHDVHVFGLASRAWEEGDKFSWNGAPASAFPVVGRPRSFGFAPKLLHELLRFNPDVVHLHGLWMYPALAVLHWHRLTGKPYVYSVHGMLSPVSLSFSPNKKRIARILFQDAVLSQASVLHGTTAIEADEFLRFGLKNRVMVIPLGIHAASVPEVQHAGHRKILSLGRFHPQKGLDRLIKAWSVLEEQVPGWALDLVGPDDDGYRFELENLAVSMKVKRISFRPPLFDAERNACMASAELFVLPTRGENFALTVAESLMMETPVIASQGAPWSGLVEEGCGWWIEQDLGALIATLGEAMSLTDEQRSYMGQRGRQWMLRDFSWQSISDKMVATYVMAMSAPR